MSEMEKRDKKNCQRTVHKRCRIACSGRTKMASRVNWQMKEQQIPLLRFLQATEIGGREGARTRERELECE